MSSGNKKVELMVKFRDDNPQKFIRYLTKLEKYTGQLRVAFEECEADGVFAEILMKYVKLMADTPEMIDIDPDARVLLNDRILFLRRLFETSRDLGRQAQLSALVKTIVRGRGSTCYAAAVW